MGSALKTEQSYHTLDLLTLGTLAAGKCSCPCGSLGRLPRPQPGSFAHSFAAREHINDLAYTVGGTNLYPRWQQATSQYKASVNPKIQLRSCGHTCCRQQPTKGHQGVSCTCNCAQAQVPAHPQCMDPCTLSRQPPGRRHKQKQKAGNMSACARQSFTPSSPPLNHLSFCLHVCMSVCLSVCPPTRLPSPRLPQSTQQCPNQPPACYRPQHSKIGIPAGYRQSCKQSAICNLPQATPHTSPSLAPAASPQCNVHITLDCLLLPGGLGWSRQ